MTSGIAGLAKAAEAASGLRVNPSIMAGTERLARDMTSGIAGLAKTAKAHHAQLAAVSPGIRAAQPTRLAEQDSHPERSAALRDSPQTMRASDEGESDLPSTSATSESVDATLVLLLGTFAVLALLLQAQIIQLQHLASQVRFWVAMIGLSTMRSPELAGTMVLLTVIGFLLTIRLRR